MSALESWLTSAGRAGWPAELGPVATGAGSVSLRPLRRSDGKRWRELRLRDRSLIQRWDPSSTLSWQQRHSPHQWSAHRQMLNRAARQGVALPFAILLNGSFAGQVTVGGIVRSPLHSGWIGYWVDSAAAGHGVATAATALATAHALTVGELHRLEATVAPSNLASQKVLMHLGYRQEGLLQRYLDIDGGWLDHQLWALTREEIPGGLDDLLCRWRSA